MSDIDQDQKKENAIEAQYLKEQAALLNASSGEESDANE